MISLDIFQIPLKRFYRAQSAAGENIASASHNLSRLCFMMAGVVTPLKLNCHPGRQNTNNILAARILTSLIFSYQRFYNGSFSTSGIFIYIFHVVFRHDNGPSGPRVTEI